MHAKCALRTKKRGVLTVSYSRLVAYIYFIFLYLQASLPRKTRTPLPLTPGGVLVCTNFGAKLTRSRLGRSASFCRGLPDAAMVKLL